MSNLYAAHHIVSDDNSIANGVVEIEDGVQKLFEWYKDSLNS